MNVVPWAVRGFFVAQGVFWAVIGGVAVRRRFARARQVWEDARIEFTPPYPEDCPRCALPLSTEAFSVICDCPRDCGVPHCKGVFAYITEGDGARD